MATPITARTKEAPMSGQSTPVSIRRSIAI
jgi:hypothetical protein